MTLQEIFDRTVRHLFTQGGPSLAPSPNGKDPSCVYRGNEGRMCAAGIWIDDAHYSLALEGMMIDVCTGEVRMEPTLREALSLKENDELRLLGSLQNAHDSASHKDNLWDRVWSGTGGIATLLWRVANDHGLRTNVVGECWPILPRRV